MSDDPDWANILEHMYDNQIQQLNSNLEHSNRVAIGDHSDIIHELGMDESEAKDALEYMLQAGLIDATSIGSPIELTTTGFEVAHERRMQEQQESREDRRSQQQRDVNRVVAILTLGLVAVSVLNSAVSTLIADEAIHTAYLAVGGGLALLVAFAVILNYFGLFSSYK